MLLAKDLNAEGKGKARGANLQAKPMALPTNDQEGGGISASAENLISVSRSKDKAGVVLPPIVAPSGCRPMSKKENRRASKSKKNAVEVHADKVLSGKKDLKKASLRINPEGKSNTGGISWKVEDPTRVPTRASRPVSRAQRPCSSRADRPSSRVHRPFSHTVRAVSRGPDVSLESYLAQKERRSADVLKRVQEERENKRRVHRERAQKYILSPTFIPIPY